MTRNSRASIPLGGAHRPTDRQRIQRASGVERSGLTLSSLLERTCGRHA